MTESQTTPAQQQTRSYLLRRLDEVGLRPKTKYGQNFLIDLNLLDLLVAMVRTGGDGPGGVSTLVIDGKTPGVSYGANERKMGWNAQPTRAVVFENARVPVENRLGEEGIGFKIAMAGLDGGRLNIAACSLGGAQSALDKSLAYVKERRSDAG